MPIKKFISKMAVKILGLEAYEIDQRIGLFYLLRRCRKFFFMMVRGRFVSLFYSKIAGNIFVGSHVKLYEKRYMTIGEKARFHNGVTIDALSTDGVHIGERVSIGEGTSILCSGTMFDIGKGVKIGDRTTFANDCFLGAAGGIEIGQDVVFGQYVRFHAENHNFSDTDKLIRLQGVSRKGIKIGNNCWVGAGAVFLDGSEIGDGCVVAANAVVTKKFPNNSVIGGVPARIIGVRGKQEEK